jgi:hypothetical protein
LVVQGFFKNFLFFGVDNFFPELGVGIELFGEITGEGKDRGADKGKVRFWREFITD